MKVLLDENDGVEMNIGDFINVYGGEYWDDDYQFSDYGIQLGDLTIANLTPQELKQIGLGIINSLLINGHQFELGRHQDGQYIDAL